MTSRTLACGTVLLLALPAGAVAQVTLELAAGVIAGTDLVRDSLVEPLAVRPTPAPTAMVTLGMPLDSGYGVTVTMGWARSDLKQHVEAESAVAITPLTVWSATLGIRRRVTSAVSAALTVGGIKYVAPEDQRSATFLRDTRAVYPTVGAALRVTPMDGRIRPTLEVGYSVHRFGTFALSDAGFTGDRTAHRVALSVSVRAFGPR